MHAPLQEVRSVGFGTDATWVCERIDSVSFRHFPGVHTSTAPGEEHCGDVVKTRVDVEQLGEPSPGGYNLFGLADTHPLEPRPIPQLKYEEPKAFSIVRRGFLTSDSTCLPEVEAGKTSEKAGKYIEIDAGLYTTALPTVEISAKPGSTVKITYCECYVVRDKNGNAYKARRDAYDQPEAELSGNVYDVVRIPSSGKTSFTPFWYRAFRFIRIEIDDLDATFDALYYRSCFYPFPEEGYFRCSDPDLTEMWKVSVNTVKCCAHEMFVDCPYYEQQQYDMDSCLEMLFTQRMISDTRLPFKSVNDLARSQIFNGMLQANYPSTMTQIIPNFTLFWVIMLREYIRYAPFCEETQKQARSLLGTLDKALESFETIRDPATGLVGSNPYWNFIDWIPGWHVGVTPGGFEGEPLTVSSMIYVKALRDAAEICEYCGRDSRSAEYRARADKMASIICEKCYDVDAGLFRNTPARREFSEHTALWATLAEVVPLGKSREILRKTLDCGESIARASFSMGFFLFRAIEKAGLYDEYAPRLFAGWQRMLDDHCTTWCENPDNPRSECHGWSSAPAYEFSAVILGAYPAENGYRTLRLHPHLFALNTEWIEGSVPTPFGTVNVKLTRSDSDPSAYSLKAILPGGNVFERLSCRDGDEFLIKLS